jgi:hypothetical protein
VFSQLTALPPPDRSHPLRTWATLGPQVLCAVEPKCSPGAGDPAPRSWSDSAGILPLPTWQPCRRWRTSPRTPLPSMTDDPRAQPAYSWPAGGRARPVPRVGAWRSKLAQAVLGPAESSAWTRPSSWEVRAHDEAVAEAGTREQRTPDARTSTLDTDTGPDTGRLDTPTPIPDTGRVDITGVDTGRSHRTPDTGRWPRTRTGSEGTAGIRTSLATTPSGCPLGRRTLFLRTVPAALGGPCRLDAEATCRCATLPLALPGSGSAASPAKPRLGALLSSDDYGSSVERAVEVQVLWRAFVGSTSLGVCGEPWGHGVHPEL